jgi:hypothetical protein
MFKLATKSCPSQTVIELWKVILPQIDDIEAWVASNQLAAH